MLRSGNITLEVLTPRVDVLPAMSPADTSSTGPGRGEAVLSLAQLAHELNSLLDGSLRYVGLALRSLDDLEGDRGPLPATDKLRRAHGGMTKMADLLERVMGQAGATASVLARRETIGQEVGWLAEMVEPMAAAEGVEITIDVDPRAASMPVGSMGTILLNGLRNAVQACARMTEGQRRIDVAIGLDDPRTLVISITDTGPGPPFDAVTPAGHGLGITLCTQIVEELGGTLEIAAARPRGTRFQVKVPVQSRGAGRWEGAA